MVSTSNENTGPTPLGIGLPSSTSAFNAFHPALAVAYFAIVLVFCMAVLHPVLTGLSFAGALAYHVFLVGWRRTLRTLAWQLPLVALIAILNPIFSAAGATEIARFGVMRIYLESICYGACMGLMFVSVMLWFSNASSVLTADKVMSVMGNTLPTISLMVSMTMRLVPKFVLRGNQVNVAQECCAPAQEGATRRQRLAERARQITVLMSWSMEDSLETADAMRARGWNPKTKRSTYLTHRMHRRDWVASIVLALLVASCILVAWHARSTFWFYPTMNPITPEPGYLLFVLLMAFPFLLEGEEWARWRR